jgi:hypothetical protein
MRIERDLSPGSLYQARLKNIARSILADKCMFFLGAGASLGPEPSLPTAAKLSREMAGECQLDFGGSSVSSRPAPSEKPVLGNATQASPVEESLPTVANLSREMAGECQLDWYDYIPLSTIAFYYESYFTRDDLNAFLAKRLRRPDILPSPTIRKLMELISLMETKQRTTFTITTNYDDKFERAYRDKFNRAPDVIIYKGAHDPHDRDAKLNCTPNGPLQREAQYWRPDEPTVLYKMHGCILQPEDKGLVITEEDYINFLTNALNEDDHEKTLLNYIKGELGYRTILFIGYSLSDWNFRAIFKATVEKHKERGSRSYAVQFRNPDQPMSALEKARWESVTTFWHEKKVDILVADAHAFVTDLLLVVRGEGGFPPEAFHAGA